MTRLALPGRRRRRSAPGCEKIRKDAGPSAPALAIATGHFLSPGCDAWEWLHRVLATCTPSPAAWAGQLRKGGWAGGRKGEFSEPWNRERRQESVSSAGRSTRLRQLRDSKTDRTSAMPSEPGSCRHGQRAANTRPTDPGRRHPEDHRPRHVRLTSPRRALRAPPRTILLRLRPPARPARAHPDPAPTMPGLSRPLGHRDLPASRGGQYAESEPPVSPGPHDRHPWNPRRTGEPLSGSLTTRILAILSHDSCLSR